MATIVAVHGNGGGGERFTLVGPSLDHLPDITLHAPTLPGFGGRPLGAVEDLDGLADALCTEVRSVDGPRILLGHGIGGSVALHLLARDPDVADGLILHAPVGTRLDTRWFPRLMRPSWIRNLVPRVIANPLARPILRRLALRQVDPEVADRVLAAYGRAEAFGKMFEWLTADWFDRLPVQPDLPAVVLWGQRDGVLDADQRGDYQRLLPRSREVTVPDWGHFPMLDRPDAYARTIAALARELIDRAQGGPGTTSGRTDADQTSGSSITSGAMLPLGGGSPATDSIGPKAALLDRCATAGLAVPPGMIVRDVHPDRCGPLGALLAAWGLGDRLAVRSAFPVEDGVSRSLAGTFRTHLDVPGNDPDALARALADVADSATDSDIEVARTDVLVMRMVAATRAGVAFTQRDHEDDLVDHVAGLADALVAGREAGERTTLPKLRPLERGRGQWQGRLQRLLRDVRRELGEHDWDIEWADDGQRCWLVQVRPITAPVARDEALTLANHREILPDLPSRFTTSVVADAAPELFGYWRGFDRSLSADRHFTEVVAGRPVINLSLLTDTMRILGLPTRFVTDSMGGSSDVSVGFAPARLLRKAPNLVALGIDQLRAVGNGRRAAQRIRRAAADPGHDLPAAVETFRTVYIELITGMFALTTAISGPLAVLDRLGVAGVLHTRQRTAGTRVIADLGPLRELVRSRPELADRIRSDDLPTDDPAFGRSWERYLALHGHRGIYESDLARPRYREDPAPLLDALLHTRDLSAPADVPLRARLVWPLWRQASRAITAREELRSDAMRVFERLRRHLLQLADEAVQRGQLPDRDAIWDLTIDELRALRQDTSYTAPFLADRRRDIAALAAYRLPDLLHRSDDIESYRRDRQASSAATTGPLRGLGLTAGEVTGTVWLVDEPTPVPDELRGTDVVLVTRGVDAGWVGVFGQVAAVIVETGGELSHGSIILRETGVPAVTNVADATARLATGDRVRVHVPSGSIHLADR
jgi:rifampicin phosphotransferase